MTGKEFDLTTAFQVLGIVAAVALVFIFWGDVLPWLRRIMSTIQERRAAADRAGAPVHVPVQPNQYTPAPAGEGVDTINTPAPDTDAADGGTDWQPRLPRYPTEEELVIYLATVRDRRGKHLRSANQIAAFSTLHRNEVLRLVREVREGVPEYRPLTAEQRALREKLQLQPNGHDG